MVVASQSAELVKIPNGYWAMVAQYQNHKQPEYNYNPMSRALPLSLSSLEFSQYGKIKPLFSVDEIKWEPHERLDCIERLSRYFEIEAKTIDLYHKIRILLLSGYLGADRNPSNPEHARRALQLYKAIQDGAGNKLEEYIGCPTVAPSLTLCGPSGIGKSMNIENILRLYPRVIIHPELGGLCQVVWIKIDCPTTSLKGLCIEIFRAFDNLLGTSYLKEFGSNSNSVDYMLAQVAQLAHKHHLGLLVIDEMQEFFKLQTDRQQVLSFLTKLDNTLGVPVIRVGTNEMEELFSTFVTARRATGMQFTIWDRIVNPMQWSLFMTGMWSFQWTKTFVPLSDELKSVFYEITQGIIDIAIKLYKMVQWKAISLRGKEIITIDLIRQVAADGLGPLLPMLEYIRQGHKDWKLRYGSIKPLKTDVYYNNCLAELEKAKLDEYQLMLELQSKRSLYLTAEIRLVIIELLDLGVEPAIAKVCAEKAMADSEDKSDISSLIKLAYKLALQTEPIVETEPTQKSEKPQQQQKVKPIYGDMDMRLVADQATKNKMTVYEAWIAAGLIRDNPMYDLFDICE